MLLNTFLEYLAEKQKYYLLMGYKEPINYNYNPVNEAITIGYNNTNINYLENLRSLPENTSIFFLNKGKIFMNFTNLPNSNIYKMSKNYDTPYMCLTPKTFKYICQKLPSENNPIFFLFGNYLINQKIEV
ncbi:MAG: hypothetical protein MUC49_19890 [Raineya sp.]|jgi:hypothetical protein|nr:hypothetical protein [Raineya sp.]